MTNVAGSLLNHSHFNKEYTGEMQEQWKDSVLDPSLTVMHARPSTPGQNPCQPTVNNLFHQTLPSLVVANITSHLITS